MTKTELKKTIVKIKKFLKKRDYDAIDTGIELARGLDEPAVFETLLDGCAIDKEGKLVRNKIFSGTGPAQPFLDYALVNLILFSPWLPKMDESLQHSNITKLYLDNCDFSSLPEGLSQIPNLDSLYLNLCYSLQNVDGLANLTNLTNLDLSWCKSLDNVNGLANLPNLTSLNLSWWSHFEYGIPDGLANLPNLTSLNLGHCNSLQNVDGLANLTNLTNLDLSWCTSLDNVNGLANLPNLTSLNLSWCDKVQPKPSVPKENMYGQPKMTTCEEVTIYQEEIKKSMK